MFRRANRGAKTRAVTCPDGRPVLVYDDAADAYPTEIGDLLTKMRAAVAVLDKLKADGGTEQRKLVRDLMFRIDDANCSIQVKYRSAYVVFQADPCSFGAYLAGEVARISREEAAFRTTLLRIREVESLLSAGAEATAVLDLLRDVHRKSLPDDVRQAVLRMAETRDVVEGWEASP